jgi:hypothetical protein
MTLSGGRVLSSRNKKLKIPKNWNISEMFEEQEVQHTWKKVNEGVNDKV